MGTAENTRKPFVALDPLGLSHVAGVKASSELPSLCPSVLVRTFGARMGGGRGSEGVSLDAARTSSHAHTSSSPQAAGA